MEKVVVFGVGRNYQKYKDFICHNFDIVGFIDNAWDIINACERGMEVYPIEHIGEMNFDKVIITPIAYYEDIYNQLLEASISKDIVNDINNCA